MVSSDLYYSLSRRERASTFNFRRSGCDSSLTSHLDANVRKPQNRDVLTYILRLSCALLLPLPLGEGWGEGTAMESTSTQAVYRTLSTLTLALSHSWARESTFNFRRSGCVPPSTRRQCQEAAKSRGILTYRSGCASCLTHGRVNLPFTFVGQGAKLPDITPQRQCQEAAITAAS